MVTNENNFNLKFQEMEQKLRNVEDKTAMSLKDSLCGLVDDPTVRHNREIVINQVLSHHNLGAKTICQTSFYGVPMQHGGGTSALTSDQNKPNTRQQKSSNKQNPLLNSSSPSLNTLTRVGEGNLNKFQ
jgi:hypothetical protein